VLLGASKVRQHERPVFSKLKAGIVRNLPRVTVGIEKYAGVSAIEGPRRGSSDHSPDLLGGGQDGINLFGRSDVVGDRNPVETIALAGAYPTVSREWVESPQNDGHPSRLEEHGLLNLLTPPAQPFVERASPMQIDDTQGNQADALIHCQSVSRSVSTAQT